MELIPPNEAERLRAVRRYDILDTPPDGTFDRITGLAARLFQVPIAIVSIVDSDRIWFKSHYGVDATQINRDPGLCASAILQDSSYIISNAAKDPRALSNPLVAGEFGLRFYAASPLKTMDGYNLGTLCILDKVPRTLNENEIATLQDLAAIVMDELELRLQSIRSISLEARLRQNAEAEKERFAHLANKDGLTSVYNRTYFMQELERVINAGEISKTIYAVFLLDIDNFKPLNDNFGHLFGDLVLKEVTSRICQCVEENDLTARLGGDEFVILRKVSSKEDAMEFAMRLSTTLNRPYLLDSRKIDAGASIGISLSEEGRKPRQLIHEADLAMYAAKSNGGGTFAVYSPAIDPAIKYRIR